MPPVGLDKVSAISLRPSSTPASSSCLRSPAQPPLSVSRSKNPFSCAATGSLAAPNEAPRTITSAEKPTRTKNQGPSRPGKPALGGVISLGLSGSLRRSPAGADGVKSTLRSEEILCEAGHRRGKIRIAGTALNNRLLLDESLVLPV